MLQNVFQLGNTPIREVMVPDIKIVSLEVTTSIEKVFEFFSEYRFTRIPVYKNNPDNIVGMVHQKDLFIMFSKGETKTLQEIIRPIMFVPESMKVIDLISKFREKLMHIAIVIDEQHRLIGLVTLEDLIEEIVGEISDEHEPTLSKIMPMGQDEWLVDATINLEDLGKFLGITFVSQSAASLASFLPELLQRVPQKDEVVTYKNFLFKIQKGTPLHVQFVHIFRQK